VIDQTPSTESKVLDFGVANTPVNSNLGALRASQRLGLDPFCQESTSGPLYCSTYLRRLGPGYRLDRRGVTQVISAAMPWYTSHIPGEVRNLRRRTEEDERRVPDNPTTLASTAHEVLTVLPLFALCLLIVGVLAAVAGGYMALAFVVAATAVVGASLGVRTPTRPVSTFGFTSFTLKRLVVVLVLAIVPSCSSVVVEDAEPGDLPSLLSTELERLAEEATSVADIAESTLAEASPEPQGTSSEADDVAMPETASSPLAPPTPDPAYEPLDSGGKCANSLPGGAATSSNALVVAAFEDDISLLREQGDLPIHDVDGPYTALHAWVYRDCAEAVAMLLDLVRGS